MADSEKYAPFLLDTELELPQLGRPCEKKGCQVTAQSSQIIKAPKMSKFVRPVRVFVYWGYAGWSASQVVAVSGFAAASCSIFWKTSIDQEPMPIDGRDSSRWVFFKWPCWVPPSKKTNFGRDLAGSKKLLRSLGGSAFLIPKMDKNTS